MSGIRPVMSGIGPVMSGIGASDVRNIARKSWRYSGHHGAMSGTGPVSPGPIPDTFLEKCMQKVKKSNIHHISATLWSLRAIEPILKVDNKD